MALVLLPIAGCALATGVLFGSLLKAVSYAPEMENTLFNFATIGFAFIETFAFMSIGAAGFLSGF